MFPADLLKALEAYHRDKREVIRAVNTFTRLGLYEDVWQAQYTLTERARAMAKEIVKAYRESQYVRGHEINEFTMASEISRLYPKWS